MVKEMNTNGFGELRVLVTGAGGPAAIAVLRSLSADPSLTLLSADMDPWASGLYLVPMENRIILLNASETEYIPHLLEVCREMRITILIPTVDSELEQIASNLNLFNEVGIKVLGAPSDILNRVLDKFKLIDACRGVVCTPKTELLSNVDLNSWLFPTILKPRRGSGSRGIQLINSRAELPVVENPESMIVQEYLPGDEYSIDVLADRYGFPLVAVPRLRVRIDSGVAVAGRTICDPILESFAKSVVLNMGLPYISNVQVRRNLDGEPALLEVNPRVPGSLALTRAAGIDMARLAVDELLGRPIPTILQHREVAMVRPLSDVIVECEDLVPGAMLHLVVA